MKRKVSINQIAQEGRGIAALPAAKRALARADAHAIFSMVTEERGSRDELLTLVHHESILELIHLCVDLTIRTRPIANGSKSRALAKLGRARHVQILHSWLDRNLWRYKGQLDLCAMDACKEVARSCSWVRKEITAYNALKRQTSNSPEAASG